MVNEQDFNDIPDLLRIAKKHFFEHKLKNPNECNTCYFYERTTNEIRGLRININNLILKGKINN